jgi:hypothetical protein
MEFSIVSQVEKCQDRVLMQVVDFGSKRPSVVGTALRATTDTSGMGSNSKKLFVPAGRFHSEKQIRLREER